MGEPPSASTEKAARLFVSDAIRGSALNLLIAGGVCAFFGFWLGGAGAWDHGFRWCLRIIGVGFLVSAALAGVGKRFAMLLAAIVDVVFALLMLVMMVEWTIEARMDGTWEYSVMLLILLAVISLSGARRSWELYNAARPAAVPMPDEGS